MHYGAQEVRAASAGLTTSRKTGPSADDYPGPGFLFAHDLFGKPLHTPHQVRGGLFPDHTLGKGVVFMAGILDGKVALVTGGASGIGRATAVAMAREGARVAVSDLSREGIEATVALINAGGGQGIAIAGDVAEEADVANMVARTVSAFGRIDCAFNNAGVAGRSVGPAGQRTHELSQSSVAKMLSINLMGVFLCMKHEIAQMLAQGGGGAIVNTASIAGLIGLATSAHYVAAKHGVVGLTKSAAIEYAQDGIRVNCVNPGYIQTPMTRETMEERFDEIMAKVPVRRLGVPEEIAEAVVWMCSEKASFMTGASHVVDGGYSAA
jgi:NAD(P)-dependent dehydrogenase (short-subunit alcohol dehydrogenase family)